MYKQRGFAGHLIAVVMSKPRDQTDTTERGVYDLSNVIEGFAGKIKMHDTYVQVMIIVLAQHMEVEAKHVTASFIKEVCEERAKTKLKMNGSPSPTYYPVFDKSQGLFCLLFCLFQLIFFVFFFLKKKTIVCNFKLKKKTIMCNFKLKKKTTKTHTHKTANSQFNKQEDIDCSPNILNGCYCAWMCKSSP